MGLGGVIILVSSSVIGLHPLVNFHHDLFCPLQLEMVDNTPSYLQLVPQLLDSNMLQCAQICSNILQYTSIYSNLLERSNMLQYARHQLVNSYTKV